MGETVSEQVSNADQKFGFVAVIGEPNAGKSTLINKIVGSKVSIVSPKVQTTRTRFFCLTSGRSFCCHGIKPLNN